MATPAIEPVRVLLVEDDEDDYLITRHMLARRERAHFAVDWHSQHVALGALV